VVTVFSISVKEIVLKNFSLTHGHVNLCINEKTVKVKSMTPSTFSVGVNSAAFTAAVANF